MNDGLFVVGVFGFIIIAAYLLKPLDAIEDRLSPLEKMTNEYCGEGNETVRVELESGFFGINKKITCDVER